MNKLDKLDIDILISESFKCRLCENYLYRTYPYLVAKMFHSPVFRVFYHRFYKIFNWFRERFFK